MWRRGGRENSSKKVTCKLVSRDWGGVFQAEGGVGQCGRDELGQACDSFREAGKNPGVTGTLVGGRGVRLGWKSPELKLPKTLGDEESHWGQWLGR